jgi:Flp pilus assembly protein TadG
VVREYVDSYGSHEAVTQAAIDLGRIAAVTRGLDALSRALQTTLTNSSARAAIIAVRAQVQEYTSPYDDYCDLIDLCTLLKEHVNTGPVRVACSAVIAAVNDAVVANGTKGSAVAHSHGLSVYFPKKMVSPLYGTLDFTKDSHWDEFVAAYLASLRR